MSDTEEEQESHSGADSAIYAVAPKLSQEEGQVDVSSSPAFQCLDDVSNCIFMHVLIPISLDDSNLMS